MALVLLDSWRLNSSWGTRTQRHNPDHPSSSKHTLGSIFWTLKGCRRSERQSPCELTLELFLMSGSRDSEVRGATLSKPSPGLHLSCFPFPSRRLLSPHLSQRPPASTPPFPSHLAAVAFSSPPTSPVSRRCWRTVAGRPAPTRAVPEPHPALLPRQHWGPP